MGKLVFFLIIAVLIYWILKSRSSEQAENLEESSKAEDTAQKSLEEMVRCAYCGVHLPRSESITSQGEFFCSNEHRLEHLDSSS
ncbi:MAG: preprotein translocase subunit YajC [Burkholderiales bacterium]|nr:preprotein translocase subunit YajC [Burkholderiales bacterium]MDR4517753.1 preprotein translocase subunit YajC [Nitrosomonas sp.]